MSVLAIDPGPVFSAFVMDVPGKPLLYGRWDNQKMLKELVIGLALDAGQTVIEQIASYGMPVGAEVFETVRWSGRFEERAGTRVDYLPRLTVKLTLCKSPKANDASIRQALIDRYGPGKEKAVGTKKNPGPLYGITKDCWSALALAVTWNERAK